MNTVGSIVNQRSHFEWLTKNQILNGILENIPVIVFRIDNTGQFTDAMGIGMQRLGVAREDVIGRRVLELFPEVKSELERALRGETVVCESHGFAGGKPWWLQN